MRAAASELVQAGLSVQLAGQVVEEHGTDALAALSQDPFTTLRDLRGYTFR